jgi:hypothetical protein
MEPEDVMHVLRRFREVLSPGGLILDLQVIRPNPVVEAGAEDVCEIDGSPLFATADPAAAEVDAKIAAGLLVEEARDDHDVRKHYLTGAELVSDFESSRRNLPRRKRAVPRERENAPSARGRSFHRCSSPR